MNNLIRTTVLGMGLTLAAAAAAQDNMIATLTEVDGNVSVNRGDGFAPAAEGMRLQSGDRLMVQDKSEATIKFDDECRREIDANHIVTVSDRSPCAGGALTEQGLDPQGTGAVGATAAEGGDNAAFWLGAAAVIGGWAFFHEDDGDTVSP